MFYVIALLNSQKHVSIHYVSGIMLVDVRDTNTGRNPSLHSYCLVGKTDKWTKNDNIVRKVWSTKN